MFKGPHSEESKKLMSQKCKGRTHSEETKNKMSLSRKGLNTWMKGRPMSEETKQKISQANKGKNTWMLGRKLPPEQVRKSADSHIGEKNKSWKGGISKDPKYMSWLKNKRNRKIRSCEGSHTFNDWEKLKSNYNNSCACCGKKEPEIILTQDHIVPVSKGGTDYIENIQPLCRSCNSHKNSKIIKYKEAL